MNIVKLKMYKLFLVNIRGPVSDMDYVTCRKLNSVIMSI